MTTTTTMMRRGSMRRRGGDSWELRVYAGVDAATGRQRYATRTVHGSKRTATRAMDELVAQVDGERMHAGTVGELLECWFDAASPGWAVTTAAHTRSIIDCHLHPRLGRRRVAAITTAEIDQFYARLLTAGGADGGALAASTVRRIHGVLHRAMTQALQWGWVWINPVAGASPRRVRRAELRPPTAEQVATLLDSVREVRPLLHCFLRLAATTGARRGQLLALRWRDIDLDRGRVAFTRALVVGPGGPVLAPTKTDRTHQVDLDHETLRIVRAIHACAVDGAAASGASLGGDAFLFAHDSLGQRPWSPDYATHQFGAVRRGAGLPHFRLHDLRHFMATQMLSSNIPLATVAQRLNHARISTTVNVYTHAIPAWDRPAAETLARLLDDAHPTSSRLD